MTAPLVSSQYHQKEQLWCTYGAIVVQLLCTTTAQISAGQSMCDAKYLGREPEIELREQRQLHL